MSRKIVVRTLLYEGEEEWLETTLRQSFLYPGLTRILGPNSITELPRQECKVIASAVGPEFKEFKTKE
jgi:hypothetical protein